MKDYYSILGIENEASQAEIKIAYRESVKQYHPDKNFGSIEYEEKLKQINEAYSILSNTNEKIYYDIKLKAWKLSSIHNSFANERQNMKTDDFKTNKDLKNEVNSNGSFKENDQFKMNSERDNKINNFDEDRTQKFNGKENMNLDKSSRLMSHFKKFRYFYALTILVIFLLIYSNI